MRKTVCTLVVFLGIAGLNGCADWDYLEFHQQSIVADGHNDSIGDFMQGRDLSIRNTRGHLDIPRMREGGLDLPFFACWVSPDYLPKSSNDPDSSAWRVYQMIDALNRQIEKYPDDLALATSASQAEAIIAEGKIACALGIEGGHAIQDDLAILEDFYRKGIRYMTLTWNNSTSWATSGKDEASAKPLAHRGLTNFGRQVVTRMNELGMMVDISHVGEQTFWDVVETTSKPIFASHSSVYNLCHHFRNLKDEQIRAVAKTDGVVLINFYSGYISGTFEQEFEALAERNSRAMDSLRRDHAGDWAGYVAARNRLLGEELQAIQPSLEDLVDHIEYIIRLVGDDYVGLGSDFDGVSSLPVGMEDASKLPEITRELKRRGYNRETIRKVLGGNFMRVFRAVCG